jgi:predicted lipoprotein with Yx(FWY)xxD motif
MQRRTRTGLGLTTIVAAAFLLITASAALAGTRSAPAQESPAASGGPLTLGTGTALTYLTGANGMTLYYFGKDTVPNQTACTSDGCKAAWPAATVADPASLPAAPAGATGTFSTFVRSDDGTNQLAYNGHPLYYFAGDQAPGDTNGEGVFWLWWVADVNTTGFPVPAEPSPAASAEASAAAGESYTVAVSSGGYLTGEDGKSLYTFAKDTTPNESACTSDQCVQNWPAFEVEADETVVAGDCVTGTLASFARGDEMQVSYNGMPLYYFAGDTAAGDTNGDGVGGVWSLAKP